MKPDLAVPSCRVVAVFDFDGTLTRHDTLAPYLARVVGRSMLSAAFAREAVGVLAWMVGWEDIDSVKRRIVRHALSGVPLDVARRDALKHAESVTRRLRPGALARIRWHREQGHRLVLASAGLDLYLEPVARALGMDDVLSSRVAVRDGFLTGEFEGADCTGPEKLRRLEALLGGLADVELHAYGDSAGDAALLAAAAHAHWKPFRRGRP